MLKLPKCTLVTGGASSGKSLFAEHLVSATGLSRIYLATSQVWDDEIAEKVKDHQRQRGRGWRTLEAPDDLSVMAECSQDEVILLDCATMWLSNALMAHKDLSAAADALGQAAAAAACPVVIVSNELGQGIVPMDAQTRAFRQAHGRMNQALAAQSEWVFGVMSGMPFALKGPAPKDVL